MGRKDAYSSIITVSSSISGSWRKSLFIKDIGIDVTSIAPPSITLFNVGAIIKSPFISVAMAFNRFRFVKS